MFERRTIPTTRPDSSSLYCMMTRRNMIEKATKAEQQSHQQPNRSHELCVRGLRASRRPSPRRGDLVLRLGVEVALLVSLAQLARRVAKDTVHHPPALHRRSLGDRIRPALDVLVVGHLQELAGLVHQALGERA